MNAQNATPTTFTHGDIHLSQAVMINGVPHFTRRAIGEFLEYPDPQRGVTKVLERNSYIEIYSSVVNMTTLDGKNREVSVYDPQGLLLVCMESQTEALVQSDKTVNMLKYKGNHNALGIL